MALCWCHGKAPPSDVASHFDNPFRGLKALRDAMPEGTASGSADTGASPVAASVPSVPVRAVVRYQRKGRGGKEVTLVEALGLTPAALEDWLKDLKRNLGCGGVVEGGALVLQGDQRERLPGLLAGRDVRRVTTA